MENSAAYFNVVKEVQACGQARALFDNSHNARCIAYTRRAPLPSILDCGCGVGGFGIAAGLCGFSTVAALYVNQSVVGAYNAIHGTSMAERANVHDTRWLEKAAGLGAHGFTMGLPCQPYASLGIGMGQRDKRDATYSALYAIWILSPDFICLECVAVFDDDTFTRALVAMGYTCRIDITQLGEVAPMHCERWTCAAWKSINPAVPRSSLAPWQAYSAQPTMNSCGFDRLLFDYSEDEKQDLKLDLAELAMLGDPKIRSCVGKIKHSWTHLMRHKHRAASLQRHCPCGCAGPISRGYLQRGGLYLQYLEMEGTLLHFRPSLIAACMLFPLGINFSAVKPRMALAMLGNAISPLQALVMLTTVAKQLGVPHVEKDIMTWVVTLRNNAGSRAPCFLQEVSTSYVQPLVLDTSESSVAFLRNASRDQYDNLHSTLRDCNFSVSARTNTKRSSDIVQFGMCFGLVNLWHGRELVVSSPTRHYPHVFKAILASVASDIPAGFTFTSVQVNCNAESAMHVDANNASTPSLILGVGDYFGGSLWIHDKSAQDMGTAVGIKGKWVAFDGLQHHCTLPFLEIGGL